MQIRQRKHRTETYRERERERERDRDRQTDRDRYEAVIGHYREGLKVSRVTLKATPATFEVLVVRIIVGAECFLLANIYRPPGGDVVAFLDELTDLHDEMTVAGGHPVLIGDFNTLGKSAKVIDERLFT